MNEEEFVQKIYYWGLLHTICGREISAITKNNPHELNRLDNMVRAAWVLDDANPRFQPDDAQAELEFYKKCDTICKMQAHTVQDWAKISFACAVGIEVLRDRCTPRFSNVDELVTIAEKRAHSEYITKYSIPNTYLSNGTPSSQQIPVSAFFPTAEEKSKNAQLVDRTLRFRDPETGKNRVCQIVDFGTSHVRGNWFSVVFDGGDDEIQITEREMGEILAAQIEDA